MEHPEHFINNVLQSHERQFRFLPLTNNNLPKPAHILPSQPEKDAKPFQRLPDACKRCRQRKVTTKLDCCASRMVTDQSKKRCRHIGKDRCERCLLKDWDCAYETRAPRRRKQHRIIQEFLPTPARQSLNLFCIILIMINNIKKYLDNYALDSLK